MLLRAQVKHQSMLLLKAMTFYFPSEKISYLTMNKPDRLWAIQNILCNFLKSTKIGKLSNVGFIYYISVYFFFILYLFSIVICNGELMFLCLSIQLKLQ